MALRGSNESLPLSDLIQSTANARRTARIVAESPEGDGQIYLVKGQVIHAIYGDLVGDDALYAMIAARELEYKVEPGVATQTRTISSSWQELLLDAARREDEGSLVRPSAGPARLDAESEELPPDDAPVFTPEMRVYPSAPPTRPNRWLVPTGLGVLAIVTAVLGWIALGKRPAPIDDEPSAIAAIEAPDVGEAIDGHVYDAGELQSADDRQPQLIEGMPALAPRRTSLMPSVVIRVQIGREGEVVERKLLRSRADLGDFETAALDAVAHYRFSPAEHAGRPVAAWLNVPVSFEQPDPRGRRAVRITGSDTIGGDLAPALAADYAETNPHVLVTIEALGSSSGFVDLFDGNAEIGASSRPIDPKELGEAERREVDLRESVIGYDGIAVIVHPDNPVRSLDMVQLAGVFSGGIANWQQVGGDDRSITLLSRPSYSGTHGLFLTKVLHADAEQPSEFAAHTTFVETSQELVSAVARDPAAIGYVGVAWASKDVTVLAIAPAKGEPSLEPTAASIGSGSYPIYRPLILYTREQLGRDSIDFLRFVLGERGQQIVAEHGFVAVGAQTEAGLPRVDEASDVRSVHVTRLLFDEAATDLSEAHQTTLTDLATHVAGSSARLAIVGNSEAEGLVKGNERLATLRASSVREFLIGRGIVGTRMEVRSAATEGVIENAERKAERRRVDVYVIE